MFRTILLHFTEVPINNVYVSLFMESVFLNKTCTQCVMFIAHTNCCCPQVGVAGIPVFTVGISSARNASLQHENLPPNVLLQILLIDYICFTLSSLVQYYKIEINFELNHNQRMRPEKPLYCVQHVMQNNPHKKLEIVGEILHETEVKIHAWSIQCRLRLG